MKTHRKSTHGLRLTALVMGGLLCASTASAANLVSAIPSDYANSEMGAITGSRVTTDVDAKPEEGVLKNLNRDPASFGIHQEGKSMLLLRQYTYSTTELEGTKLIDPNSKGASAAVASGKTTAVPNMHAAAASDSHIYMTGYDLGKIGVARQVGKQLTENKSAVVDLKEDIKKYCHYNFNETFRNEDENKEYTGDPNYARVHGEALLTVGRRLYVATSVNPKGGYEPYDDGFLMQYDIQDDGSLKFGSYTRIGRNIDQGRLNQFNDHILISCIGGYQHYDGTGNVKHTEISVAKIDENGRLSGTTRKRVTLPGNVASTGEDMRDLKVLPNGTAYVMTYNLSPSGSKINAHVYQTTVSNLMSEHPDDWTEVASVKEQEGWFGKLNAEHHTKRLWLEMGDQLKVYTDGDKTAKYTWQAKDFSENKAFSRFNKITMIDPDWVTGTAASVVMTLPAELGGGTTAAEENEYAVWKDNANITAPIQESKDLWDDPVVTIGKEHIGDKKTNVVAAIYAYDNDISIDADEVHLQVENTVGNPTGIYAGNGKNVTINPGTSEVDIITRGMTNGNSLTNAIHIDPTEDKGSNVHIDAPVNISMSGGLGGNGIAIQKTDRFGEKSYKSNVESKFSTGGGYGVRIVGKRTNEWGIPLNRKNVFSRFNNAGILTQVERGNVTIDGPTYMLVYGNGVTTNAPLSQVNLRDTYIQVPSGTKYSYYALGAYQGRISVNAPQTLGSSLIANKDVQLDGDLFALSTGRLDVALATNKSYLHGLVDSGGTANLYLKNGAKWLNESRNERYYQDNEDIGAGSVTEVGGKKIYRGKSRVTNFYGGDTAATYGIIYQKDAKNLDIDNYSGHTTVVYEHDTASPTTIKGGDIVVDKAVGTENVMTLFTDANGITGNQDEVLNALANKLTYKSHAEAKLKGKLLIAEGLTSSTARKDITFQTNGKGSYAAPAAEQNAPITAADAPSGTYTLSGNERRNLNEAEGGFGFGGKHAALANYTKNAGGNAPTDLTVDLAGHRLTLGMTSGKKQIATVYAAEGKKLTIKDATGSSVLTLSANGTAAPARTVEAISAAKNATLNIESHVQIDAVVSTEKQAHGVAANDAKVTLKSLTIKGIRAIGDKGVGTNVYGIGIAKKANVTVAEDVNIEGVRGIGLYASTTADGGAINIGGGKIVAETDPAHQKNYWAAYAAKGTITLNGGKNRKLNVVGNMFAGGTDSSYNGTVDASFTTADSSWTGAMSRSGMGKANLTLTNGATWTHEVQAGKLAGDSSFTTSHLTKFTGGAAAAQAGIVKQGAKNILIDEYSGHMRFVYAHDETAPTTIKGGNVTITKAADDSHVTLSTNHDASITDGNAKDVLNALANKLYYTAYKSGEKKLAGTVEINEGLTYSTAKWKGQITYNAATGQGTYDTTTPQPPTEQQKTEFTEQIKPSNVAEYVNDNVEKTEGVYTFTKDTTIKSSRYNGAIYGNENPVTVNAVGKTLNIEAKQTGSGFLTGIYHYGTGLNGSAAAGAMNIQAGTLNLNVQGKGRTFGIYNMGNGLLHIKGQTNISISGGTDDGDEVTGIETISTGTTVLEGLTIRQEKSTEDHRAIRNKGLKSKLYVNMDEVGTLGTNKVDIQGNVLTDGLEAMTNLALTTADSKIHGTLRVNDGALNLWLMNGASWYNEHYGKHTGLYASKLTRLTGGSDAAHAGNVYMREDKDLTVKNYAGHTNFFFEHAASNPTALKGGDVKIEKAAAGSHATMITEHTGVTPSNVTDVLKALAKKLWYMDSTDSHNLSGTVKVLEGLTASSAQIANGLGYIDFDENHRGFYRATAPVYHDQTKENFTTPITNTDADTEYISDGVRKSDGHYDFKLNQTTITTGGAALPSGIHAAVTNNAAAAPLSVEMRGHDLNVNIDAANAAGVAAIGKEITVKDAGDLDITAKGTGAATALLATNGGKITIGTRESKTVKLRATSTAPADSTVVKAENGSSVAINGLADIEADGTKTSAAVMSATSDVSIAGGTLRATNGAALVRAYGDAAHAGRVDLNVTKDSTGAATGAAKNKLVLDGNLHTSHGAKTNGIINVGLNTSDSSWTGDYMDNSGTVNLWMGSGAKWTGKTGANANLHMNLLDSGSLWKLTGASHVKNLAASAHTGRSVFDMQGTAATDKLSIDNFSGNAYFFYGNTVTTTGTEKTVTVNGGEIHIKKAASGSSITLHTDAKSNTTGGWDWTSSAGAVEQNLTSRVVKMLANKLYYEGAITNENNLSLTVKVAEGLTTSSAARTFTKANGLTFNKTTGQADFNFTPVPEPTPSTAITATKTLTKEYLAKETAPNAKDDGGNPVVSALYAGSSAYTKANPMIVDMNGYNLTVRAESSDKLARAINLSPNAAIEIRNAAGKTLTISAINKDTRAATGIYAGTNSSLKIKGPVVIDEVRANNYSVSGITTGGTIGQASEVLIDGDLTVRNLIGKTTGAAGDGRNLSALHALNGKSKITVTGSADIQDVKGSVLRVAGSTGYEAGGTIDIGGGTLSAASDADKSKQYRVLTQQTGKVNINMNGTDAGTRKTVLRGDMYAVSEYGKKSIEYGGGSLGNYNTTGTLNVALTTQDSSWHGALLYETTTSSRGTGGVTNLKAADVNLWLQNGAQWTNEQLSGAHETWKGSRITTFRGGSDEGHAGVIFQKDAKPITLDSYSGHTKVLYAHNAATPTQIIGGDLTIGKAAANSVITLTTDSTGLNTASTKAADKNLVSATLDALAKKLYYTAYTNDEKNLTGKVEIAEGLTASSASKRLENITFNKTNGQGGYVYTPATDPSPPSPGPDPKPPTPGPDPKPPTPGPDPKPPTPKPTPQIEYGDYETKLMSGVKSAMTASTMAWRAEANDLMKRMGDLRLSPQEAGVWARAYRGKATSNKDNANYRMNYSTIQVGYDKKVGNDWRVGVAGSYMSGTSSYAAGNGKNKEGNLGVYGTWTGKSGQYVDLIAKIGRLQNEYTVYNDFGHYVKADYSMWGGSLSAEYGKRIAMKGGSFVEPQVELIYSHMQGKSYVGSTDYRGMSMYVHQKPFDSFIGRLGFGIGKETERGTCYARVSLYHEFAGDMHTDYSDGYTPKSTIQRGSDTWLGVQLGGTLMLNDRTNLYGNFEKTFGGDIQTAWRMDVGMRWNF